MSCLPVKGQEKVVPFKYGIFVNVGLIGVDNTPSDWAEQAFTAATDAGVLDGTNPHGLVTREQLAQVLVNVGLVGTGQKTDAEEPQTE